MMRQLAWGVALCGAGMSGAGCVSYQHTALAVSLSACRDREMAHPSPIRQRIYLFLMNGGDPLDDAGLCHLRDQVVRAGYPKVYTTQMIDGAWYERECRRVAQADPAARIVLLGIGGATNILAPLAAGLVADGVTVDALVLLDPRCEHKTLCERPCRTLVLRSRGHAGPPVWADAEEIRLDQPPLHKLAGSADCVSVVVKLMAESADKVGAIDGDPLPSIPLTNKPNPTPRSQPPELVLGPPDEWDFLRGPPKGGVPAVPPETREPTPHPLLAPAPIAPPAGESLPPPRKIAPGPAGTVGTSP